MTASTPERPAWRDWPELRIVRAGASRDTATDPDADTVTLLVLTAPRLRRRRRTALGRALLWLAARLPALVVLALAVLLTVALLREATP